MISQLQEKLCLGNSVLTPYWLPSRDPIGQRCHILLRNRYRKLDRLVNDSNSLLLLCMAERSPSLNEKQKQYCDHLLFQRINELREKNGSPNLDQCFQGKKRFERQCGPLRQCCHAYDQCKELVRRSFITEQIQLLSREIQNYAKKCKEGIASINGTVNFNYSSALTTFTSQKGSDDIMENFLRNSPHQWYLALKAKLMKEMQNSKFQSYKTVSYDGLITDKNDSNYRVSQNIANDEKGEQKNEENRFPDEIAVWDNTEYKKDIEEYQVQKGTHRKHLKHTEVEKNMDRCQILWNNMNQAPLLSTVTLLRIGDRCIGQGDNSFTELYELAIERNDELHKCLDRSHNQTDKSIDCSVIPINRTHWHWTLIDSDDLRKTTSSDDCLAQVNLVQFKCAQLRKCCPNFYRCQNETFDAKAELRIALLTVQLITQHYDCLRHQLVTETQL
ncbi:unnamed protein product [Cercopithifilaria johnstoni]|uniref:Uncharacterized protein n=1 Tax=Cercopithifilaria johnstoni TaxID=2874296 RepID=A0A8J2M927_9BILA|nr:unnamed protein product [Cercopithifilaria johnstoni]